MLCEGCYRISIVFVSVWAGENDSNMLRVDAFFSEKGQKNLHFQKYLDTCGRFLRAASFCISFHGQ